jgi:drug/metabolite transporter (DMT)-like permease
MNARQRSASNLGLLLVALGAATWSTDTFLRAKLTEPFVFSPVTLVLGEHLVLAFFAIPVIIRAWQEVRQLHLGQWAALAFIGWGGSATATILFSQGFLLSGQLFAHGQYAAGASAINALVLLQQTQPIFAVLAAVIFLRERLTWWYAPIFVISAIGAYLVAFAQPGQNLLTPFTTIGGAQLQFALIALGSAFFWGASTAMGRLLSDTLRFVTLTAARFAMALPFLLVWGIIAVPNLPQSFVQGLSQGNAALYLVLLALVPGLIGLLLYYRGLRQTRASYATLAELAFPATTLLITAFALHAPAAPLQLVGVALIAGAVVTMNLIKSGVRVAEKTPVPEPVAGASA